MTFITAGADKMLPKLFVQALNFPFFWWEKVNHCFWKPSGIRGCPPQPLPHHLTQKTPTVKNWNWTSSHFLLFGGGAFWVGHVAPGHIKVAASALYPLTVEPQYMPDIHWAQHSSLLQGIAVCQSSVGIFIRTRKRTKRHITCMAIFVLP